MAFKMKGKSPMMKALIGKQNTLPEQIQAAIKAAPLKKETKYLDDKTNPKAKAKGKSMKDFALNSQARRDEYNRRGWAQDSTTKVAASKPMSKPKPKSVDGAKRGVNQSGETTTSKNKGRTLVVSSGRTSGRSTVVNKDRKMKVDQTPSPDIKKVKRKDKKVAMDGMNRQERKNYRDLQDTKKDMRKQSSKDAKAKAKEVTGRGSKARRAKRADVKDAKINKKLLAAADKKANTQKAADALEKDVASSAMKNYKKGYYKK